jgi:hypothetical protein
MKLMRRMILFLVILIIPLTCYMYTKNVDDLSNKANLTINLLLVVLFPLLFWLFFKRKIFFIFSGFLIGLIFDFFIIPSGERLYFNYILKAAVLIEISFVLFMLNNIRITVKEMKKHKNETGLEFWDRLDASMSRWLENPLARGAVIMEFKTIYYSIVASFKKPDLPEGHLFTYHKKTMFKTFIILMLVLIPFDAIIFHFLLGLWSEILAVISTIINIYAFFYVIALNNSVKYLPVVISNDKLTINSGYTGKIVIDFDKIESLGNIENKGHAFFDKVDKGIFKATVGIDEPELELKLNQPIKYQGPFGIQKWVNSVLFRVDEPQQFKKTLEEALNKNNSEAMY